jgi:hypothetical protein
MTVVMKVANQRHVDPHPRQGRSRIGATAAAASRRIDGDPHQLRSGARQLGDIESPWLTTSTVSVLVIDWTTTGAAGAVPPTPTFPTMTRRLGRRAGEARDIALIPG